MGQNAWMRRVARAGGFAASLVSAGCGDDTAVAVATGDPPADAGVVCREGEVSLEDGACSFRAGIGEEQCGAGFIAAGDRSCAPVLPAEACPKGTMAVPGESACRPVAPCGDTDYAGIPVDDTTQHVSQAYGGSDNDGTAAHPWRTIQEGIDAAASGAVVAIAEGSYVEDLAIDQKPVRLWGRCPERVEIVGSVPKVSAVGIYPGMNGAEVHRVALRGDGLGIAFSGVSDVLIEEVWIHDTASRGIAMIPDPTEPTSFRLARSLVEATTEVGVFFTESGTVEASVIRGTVSDPDYGGGNGVMVQGAGTLTLRGSVVDDNLELGVYALGSAAEITETVVSRTAAHPDTGYGIGVIAAQSTDGTRANLMLRSSFIADNASLGIGVVDSDATIETTVVRGTLLSSGVEARAGTIAVKDSVMEANPVAGFRVIDAAADLEGLLVRDNAGYGILAQHSTLDVRSSRIERNRVVGVFMLASSGSLDAVALTETTIDEAFGGGADGLAVQSTGEPVAVTLSDARVTGNARSGVTAFGAAVSVTDVFLDCNAIDFDGETDFADQVGRPFAFEQNGDVRCGCGAETAPCLVVSSSYAPPLIP
jgi:hypothetical protein